MQNPQVADLDYSDLPLTNEPHMVYCFFNNICTGIFELQNHWSNKTQPPLDFGLLGQCKANSLILHFLGAKYVLPVHIQLGHCANSSIWSCFISDLIWHIFFFFQSGHFITGDWRSELLPNMLDLGKAVGSGQACLPFTASFGFAPCLTLS